MRAEVVLELDDETEYRVEVTIERGDASTTETGKHEALAVTEAAFGAMRAAADLLPQRYYLGSDS